MLNKIDKLLFLNSIAILLLTLTFGEKTFIDYSNIRPVISIKQNKDKFYVEYEVNNILKVEKYDELPVCENYAIVDKNYNFKVLFTKLKLCKEKSDLSLLFSIKLADINM